MLAHKFDIIIPPQSIDENPECVKQIASGDEKAFAWLYKNYCKRLYDYIYLLTNEEALSEDIVQEVFLKLWINRGSLDKVENMNAYLYVTAKHLLLNLQKRSQREKVRLKEVGQLACSFTNNNPLEEKERKEMVLRAVGSLTQRQQMVYRMVREEGRTRDEISKELNLSPFTVKCTMQNALKKLREAIR